MEPEPEHDASAVTLSGLARLVRANRNFRHLWLAQIVSELGDWFYTLAIYTLLLQLTGKASSVGLALTLQVLPQTFIGPTAGLVNDRIKRKRVMIAADLVRMVVVFSMLLVRSRSMVWLVYPLLLLETIMAAFFEPARSSVIPNITPREDVLLANTLSASTWSLNLTIGATVGGIVGALLGRDAVFIVNAASFLGSALLISRMQFSEPHAENTPAFRMRELIDFSPIVEGLRYVRGRSKVLVTMFAKAGLLTIGPGWVLFTVMGQRVFPVHWHGLDPQRGALLGMSLLLGGRGLGAFVGPLVMAPWAGNRENKLRLGIFGGFLLVGVGYMLFGLAPSLGMAAACLALAHFGGSTIWVFSTTLLQLHTDDQFRGRVFAAELGLCMLTIAVGAFLAGLLVDAGVNPRALASGAGLLMILPTGIWAWTMRKSVGQGVAVET